MKIAEFVVYNSRLCRINRKSISLLLFVLILEVIFYQGCEDYRGVNNNGDEYTCESCHINAELLQEISSQLPARDDTLYIAEISGVAERYKRVLIGMGDVTGFDQVEPVHSEVGCVACHDGTSPVVATTPVKAMREAHGNTLLKDPSLEPELRCYGSTCHASKVETYLLSLHNTLQGLISSLVIRSTGFDSLTVDGDSISSGFRRDCAACHASCGQCHVSRPSAVGGGLVAGHAFNTMPSIENNCILCHYRTVGREITGEIQGNNSDVHYQIGMLCSDCHSEDFHGDGNKVNTAADVSPRPDCASPCHSRDSDDNLYHRAHWPGEGEHSGLACTVCHAQNYTQCSNCHAGEYDDGILSGYSHEERFYLGLNPESATDGIRWITIRHIPVTRTTFEAWNLQLDNFTAVPTYKPSWVHAIQRWTERTLIDSTWLNSSEVAYNDSTCNLNCHYHANGTQENPVNRSLYLSLEDLPSDEKEANRGIGLEPGCDYSACHRF